ncbi:MAG: T9SS type A sorting domain-containing protein [Bacteroidota bacterium]
MKKSLLFGFILFLIGFVAFGQTTATDFTLTDCAGNPHSLFTDLDAGKVIVISFVMPCASCIAPSVSAYDVVQNYTISDPGRVVFYLSDDNGTTSCSTLNAWASQNGMPNATVISTTALKMSQYNGNGVGMPKIVVLGGSNHTVYYNENDGDNSHDIDAAIIQALGATGMSEVENTIVNLNILPNPVKNSANISYSLNQSKAISIEIFNVLGEKLKTIALEKQTAGKHTAPIDLETFSNGIYFIKLNASASSETVKFTVAH